MAQKKAKKASDQRKPVTLRFSDNEMAYLQTDRREIQAQSIPVSFSAYGKHAILSYPRLRKIEAELKKLLPPDGAFVDGTHDPEVIFAKRILDEVTR